MLIWRCSHGNPGTAGCLHLATPASEVNKRSQHGRWPVIDLTFLPRLTWYACPLAAPLPEQFGTDPVAPSMLPASAPNHPRRYQGRRPPAPLAYQCQRLYRLYKVVMYLHSMIHKYIHSITSAHGCFGTLTRPLSSSRQSSCLPGKPSCCRNRPARRHWPLPRILKQHRPVILSNWTAS